MSQLLSGNQGLPLLKSTLDSTDLSTLMAKKISNHQDAYRSRRRLEAILKLFFHSHAKMGLKEKIELFDKIFDNVLEATVKLYSVDPPYLKYKGLFSYDRFLIDLATVTKLKIAKQFQVLMIETQHPTTPDPANNWMVYYLKEIVRLLKIPNLTEFMSPNLFLHILWEVINIYFVLSQVRLIDYDALNAVLGCHLCMILDPNGEKNVPKDFQEAVIYMFCTYIKNYHIKEGLSQEKTESQSYDETNVFDLKLQEFFVINFTSIKVELKEYFNNLSENKFPKFLVIFNKSINAKIGNLLFFNKFFTVNHNSNFKVSLAFLLLEQGECIRCENIIKQILEKSDSTLQTKLTLIYKLAVILFTDYSVDTTKALLYSKELLNLLPRTADKRSTEYSQAYFMNAFIYYKSATRCKFEGLRVTHKSNAFDYLKIALDFDKENYFAKLMKGILLMDVGFSQKDGLKLIQEVNAAIPYRFVPMVCLGIAFSYLQDLERAVIVIKECCQRFQESVYICYIILAHLKVQEMMKKFNEDNIIPLEFPDDLDFNLKEMDSNKDKEQVLVITDGQLLEIETLMKKALKRLTIQYNLVSAEIDSSSFLLTLDVPRLSELIKKGASVELLVKYEQVVIFWAKLLITVNRVARIPTLLVIFDTKHTMSSEVSFLRAMDAYGRSSYPECISFIREVLKDQPTHHETLLLFGSLYLKTKDLISEAESESLLTNAVSIYESPEGLNLLGQLKLKNNEKEAALELFLRAFNMTNNKPLFTFDGLDLTFGSLTGNL